MKISIRCPVTVVTALLLFQAVALDVVERDGVLSIARGNETIVSALTVDRGDVGNEDVQMSFRALPDGSKVWNRWSEVRDRRFRLEVAKRIDGAVEITVAGQMEPSSSCRRRFLDLHLPDAFLRGKGYEYVTDDVRKYQTKTGVFDGMETNVCSRWMAADGVTFDFNPLGPGDAFGSVKPGEGWAHADAVRGYAYLSVEPGGWRVRTGDEVKSSYGGYVGGKIVIREGEFADYDKFHLIRTFHYSNPLTPVRLLAFGSPRRGAGYSEGDLPFASERGYGWVGAVASGDAVREPIVGFREGAYYSAIKGRGDAIYRFDGLSDGHYLFTFAAGNFSGVDNLFSITAGGRPVLSDASVPTGKVRTVTCAVHVRGGCLDVKLSGNWIVSVLALQPVLGDGEDFSVGRGYWVSRGYEPGVIFRSDDWMPYKPGLSDVIRDLPVPGTEFADEPHDPPAPVELPDSDSPDLAWTKSARIHRFFNNSSTLAELDDPVERENYIDGELAGKGVNSVMISGLLARHTQPARLDATVESVGEIVRSLHRRGVKAFDHIDATLLWNTGFGFRLMLERPGELLRTWNDDMPSYQFCVSNPQWRETFYAYLRKILETGVDALQIDELYHWRRGCICRHCCERFNRETEWRVPLNECDPAWSDSQSQFRRRWRDWRIKNCTNWFVELRRRNRDIAPNLVLSAYTVIGGFISSASGDIGRELLDLARVINFFGIEVMSRSVMRSSRAEVPFHRAENILTFAHGAPVWNWYYNFNWQSDYVAWGMSEMMRQTPMLSEIPHPSGTPDYMGFDISRGAMVRPGSKAVGEVALFFSSHTRDYDCPLEWCPSLFGIAQALEALHVPYVFVPDVNLTPNRLSSYRVLFLTGFERLSKQDAEAISAFRNRGGRVVCGIEGAKEFCHPALLHSPSLIGVSKYDFSPNPEKEQSFRQRVMSAVGDARWWRIDAPDQVMTSVWREKSGALAIHLLNLTGVRHALGQVLDTSAPDPAFPQLERDIVFTVPCAASCGASAVSPEFSGTRPLMSHANADGSLTVTIPRSDLGGYMLIRIAEGRSAPNGLPWGTTH